MTAFPLDLNGLVARPGSQDGAAGKFLVDFDGGTFITKYGSSVEPGPEGRRQGKLERGSYDFAPYSEWLGSHVFEAMGIDVQETHLGVYREHVVVACRDFTKRPGLPDLDLISFANLMNSLILDSRKRTRLPQLEVVEEVIATHPQLEGFRGEARRSFYRTLIGDSVIGNFDRHAGNWGYLFDPSTHEMVGIAPVYDCGSSMYSRMDEEGMRERLGNFKRQAGDAKTLPKAALFVDGRRVFYHEFLMSEAGEPARRELVELAPRIESIDVDGILDRMPLASGVRKRFYSENIRTRIASLLAPAYRLGCEELGVAASCDLRMGIDLTRKAPSAVQAEFEADLLDSAGAAAPSYSRAAGVRHR